MKHLARLTAVATLLGGSAYLVAVAGEAARLHAVIREHERAAAEYEEQVALVRIEHDDRLARHRRAEAERAAAEGGE